MRQRLVQPFQAVAPMQVLVIRQAHTVDGRGASYPVHGHAWGLEEADTALVEPYWTLELFDYQLDETKCLLGTEGETPDMMLELVLGDVMLDHILVCHHLHCGRVSGPHSRDEELEVLTVIGQHCPYQRRLEGGVL